MITIPILGLLEVDPYDGWLKSQPIEINALSGKFEFILEEYETDPQVEDFHTAVQHFLALDHTALEQAQDAIYQYYQDCCAYITPASEEHIHIPSPNQVWRHIEFGDELMVSRRLHGDNAVYISLTCHCDWEPEHSLQIVFKQGLTVNKIGAFDGHLSHADAYDDPRYEDMVYVQCCR